MFRLIAVAATTFIASSNAFGAFASSIINYTPGVGVNAGYDNPAAALGEPSRFTEHQFGGPVDPFNSAFTGAQVVSIGTGGSLTVQFTSPLLNAPGNPYDLDFTIFGNAGFVYSDFTAGITDGSLYGGGEGTTRLSVSSDGITFFTLAGSPNADALFPTDGIGNFSIPVNPAYASSAFSGLTLAGIRNLYAGSGGGTSYDINWAVDAQNQSVHLDYINFITVEVLSGKIEIDGFSAVPEPSTVALFILGIAGFVSLRRIK